MPRPHSVRWGPSSLPKRGTASQFSAHFCCGQTAAWIKMPLGTEVGLGSGDIVLDGDPAPPSKRRGGTAAPHFSAMSVVAKRSPISATAEHLSTFTRCVCVLCMHVHMWHLSNNLSPEYYYHMHGCSQKYERMGQGVWGSTVSSPSTSVEPCCQMLLCRISNLVNFCYM